MSQSPRGPSGAALPPPKNINSIRIPIVDISAGDPLYRVHSSAYGPIFYGPGANKPPTFRFDPQSGNFGILYISPLPDAAMIETLLRNPERTIVDYKRDIQPRSLSTLVANRNLRLTSMLGENLSTLGLTAAISTGPYGPCAKWSDALFNHPTAPDGIIFASRHNPDELCIALFEKKDITLKVSKTEPLDKILGQVGKLLDRHSKSISGLP